MEYEVKTLDGLFQINDLQVFSRYEDSYLWSLLNEKGIGEFERFVENNLTTATLQIIIHFYKFDKWLCNISIKKVYNPYCFLNLPPPDDYDNFADDEFSE